MCKETDASPLIDVPRRRMQVAWMNVELFKRIENVRLEEMRRDAEIWRLLRQGQRDRSGRLARHGRWLLCQLGRWLVAQGQQLQAYGRYQHGLLEP
jgi:hypothetical protein